MITITVARALKLKNKIVSEIRSLEELIRTENVVEGENTSQFKVVQLSVQLRQLRDKLATVKGAIARANEPQWEKIFLLSELKSQIAFLKSIPTKYGSFEEGGYGITPSKNKKYVATITKQDILKDIAGCEKDIEKLQEDLDIFNHSVKIDINFSL